MFKIAFGQLRSLRQLALQGCSRASSSGSPQVSSARQNIDDGILSIFRTSETDPNKHTTRHEGLFYTVSKNEAEQWMKLGARPHFHQLNQSFGEVSVMVRTPAVEIIDYMRNANYQMPVIRYVLYGDAGCGKTTTMLHLLHFCGRQNWIVMHVPWAAHLNRYDTEITASDYKEGRLDQNNVGKLWLTEFRRMNAPLLNANTELKTSNSYAWTKREITEAGSSLLDLIDFGLNRPKFACDVLGVLTKEIKILSSENKCRFLLAVDGVNALWQPTIIKRKGDGRFKHGPEELTLACMLRKMIRNDWAGGAVLCSVDALADSNFSDPASYLPRYLLQKEGFDTLDPFVPVHVPDYSEKEAISLLHYYVDKKWITHPQALTLEGRRELFFLSSMNPYALHRISINW